MRPGLALYGISPVKTALPLSPALSLHAPIQQIRAVPKGTPIGYGGDFMLEAHHYTKQLPQELWMSAGKLAYEFGTYCMEMYHRA